MNGRTLQRTTDGRILAGVCSGVAAYLGIDPNIVRLILVASLLLGGAGFVLYVAAWLLLPEEGQSTSIAQDFIRGQQQKKNP